VDLPLPGAGAERKVVLAGELTAGDSVLIRAGQSTPISAASGTKLVQDLSLLLRDASGISTTLRVAEDHLSYTLFTLPYSSPRVIVAGETYQLQSGHPELPAVTAEVQVPRAFTATLATIKKISYNGDSALSLELLISDPGHAKALYVIEAIRQPVLLYGYFSFNGNEYRISENRWLYDSLKSEQVPVSERYDTSYSGLYERQQVYTTDAASENLAGASPGRPFGRIFIPGRAFGSPAHYTQILIPEKELFGEHALHAQTTVYVKSVSPDYYDFLKAYEQYDPTTGVGGNTAPLKLEGNVNGGFGMVGGVYRWTYSVVY
jgi:hypothetical protein